MIGGITQALDLRTKAENKTKLQLAINSRAKLQPSGLPLSEKIQEKPMAVIESTSPEKKGEKLSGRVLRGMPDEELLAYAKNTINEEKISKMDKLATDLLWYDAIAFIS